MAIVSRAILNAVTVKPSGHLEVQLERQLVDDATGSVVGYPDDRNWRGVVDPGDTAKADALGVRSYADIAWTPEVLDAWEAAKASQDEGAA